jgi:endonuclease/exonuclease/phosphatase family metal-dependent hydrolase
VLTLNVNGLPSGLPPLRVRAAALCQRVEWSGADVVAFQEVWTRRQLALLRAGLPAYPDVAWQPGPAGQPAGGLATFSRIPVRSVTFTWFRGARPDRGGRLFRARLALKGRYQGVLVADLGATAVANTHLTANRDGDWSAANRHHAFQRTQLALLHRALRLVPARLAVTCGDFNVASDCPLYPDVVDGGAWHDPFAADDPPTFHADLLPPGRSPRRIDYLLVRGDHHRVLDTDVLFAEPVAIGGRRSYLSDHVGLSARIGAVSPR